MENIVVAFLKLGFLVLSVILIGVVIDWTFKHLGFYKRDGILNGVFSIILFVLGLIQFFALGITRNSFEALRGDVIFTAEFLLGILISCFLLVLLRNFIRKRKILFISPNLNNFSEEEKVRVEKYLGNLRKTRSRIHFHVVGVSPKGQSCLDTFSHLIELISTADEIHIWRADNCINEIAFILGGYLYHRYFFWEKNIVIVNNGGSVLCSQNTVDKILSNLEWSGY